MEMVVNGPAIDISICSLSAIKVGAQFLIAHPGKLGTAKYKMIIQNEKEDSNPVTLLMMEVIPF
jgi:hypothetical protein